MLPAVSLAATDALKVTQIINGKSLVLESGDTVRLASIEVPNVKEEKPPYRNGEPLGDEARKALENLVAGKSVQIDAKPGTRDRHNRLLGQVFTSDGVWLQGAMLTQGYAMVYSFNDDSHDVIEKMLAHEREARAAGRGIWAHPYFRIITPQETSEFINRFKIVEGVIKSVNLSHDNMYINFSEHWKGQFAVFISRKYTAAFAALNPQSLVGKKVRVRGWINYHNAPMIDITHPEQIEME